MKFENLIACSCGCSDFTVSGRYNDDQSLIESRLQCRNCEQELHGFGRTISEATGLLFERWNARTVDTRKEQFVRFNRVVLGQKQGGATND